MVAVGRATGPGEVADEPAVGVTNRADFRQPLDSVVAPRDHPVECGSVTTARRVTCCFTRGRRVAIAVARRLGQTGTRHGVGPARRVYPRHRVRQAIRSDSYPRSPGKNWIRSSGRCSCHRRLDTDGRAYYRRKHAEGKKPLEAIRCLNAGSLMPSPPACRRRPASPRADRCESGKALRGVTHIQRGRLPPAHRHFGSATSRTREPNARPCSDARKSTLQTTG